MHTQTDRAPLDRYRKNLYSGQSFRYIAASAASADRMNYAPAITAAEYGEGPAPLVTSWLSRVKA